jgi:hypothetical protein
VNFAGRTESLAQKAVAIHQAALFRLTLSLVAATYLPLFLSAIALSAMVLFRKDCRRRLGWLAVLVLFVYSYNAAASLEVAVINSLDVPRHATAQVFFTIVAQFLALWLICEVALERRIRGKLFPRVSL